MYGDQTHCTHDVYDTMNDDDMHCSCMDAFLSVLRGVEWVQGLFLFSCVLGKNIVATCKIGSFLGGLVKGILTDFI